jgi:hypothetical protein
MVRTTPPRPVDIAELFPELREHSTTATRLHPRPGAPTAADSSVGGPLLWPAADAWPICDDAGAHEPYNLTTPAAVHRRREILATANAREPLPGGDFLTADERAELDAAEDLNLDDLIECCLRRPDDLGLHRGLGRLERRALQLAPVRRRPGRIPGIPGHRRRADRAWIRAVHLPLPRILRPPAGHRHAVTLSAPWLAGLRALR